MKSSDSERTSLEPGKRAKAKGGPLTRAEIKETALRLAGVTEPELGAEVIGRARDLMDAKKTRFAQHEGEFTDSVEVEDNPTRLGAVRLGAEIAGIVSSRSGGEGSSKPVAVIILPVWSGPDGPEPKTVEPAPAAS